MKEIMRWQRLVHYAAAMIGGFWGGYTIFNHMDIFGNAQTGNLIKAVLSSAEGKFAFVGWMLLSFLVYAAGNVFYVLVCRRVSVSMKIVSLICSGAAVILTGAIADVAPNDFVACYPLIFAAPVQWNAYKIANGNSSSTIFSSNNVRQAVMLTTNYCLSRSVRTAAKARFYWLTLLAFHIGVAFSCFMSLLVGLQSIWLCFVPILLTTAAYCVYQNEKLRVAALVSA